MAGPITTKKTDCDEGPFLLSLLVRTQPASGNLWLVPIGILAVQHFAGQASPKSSRLGGSDTLFLHSTSDAGGLMNPGRRWVAQTSLDADVSKYYTRYGFSRIRPRPLAGPAYQEGHCGGELLSTKFGRRPRKLHHRQHPFWVGHHLRLLLAVLSLRARLLDPGTPTDLYSSKLAAGMAGVPQ